MKAIAYYLPQYHRVKENDEWWGKGFTEWTNVKKSKKLYSAHNQPFEPLDDNYYDLMDKKTVNWQTKLLEEYNIYGLCYYHYWFRGKKILEKPAENLLKWKEIKQNFCFCWANHSWKRTWNGLNEILIEQEYGDEKDWEIHFNYLKDFFRDDRYIKKENKPIFLIFQPHHINNLDSMIEYFNKKCIEIGFSGIYIIESKSGHNIDYTSKKSSARVMREPNNSLGERPIFSRILHRIKRSFKRNYLYFPHVEKYEKIIKYSISSSKKYTAEDFYPTVFTSWDNTSRHGRRGYIIENSTPKLFKNYLEQVLKIMEERNSEFLFINAWNEWAEGMFLEPDKRNKFGYLEVIKEVSNLKE